MTWLLVFAASATLSTVALHAFNPFRATRALDTAVLVVVSLLFGAIALIVTSWAMPGASAVLGVITAAPPILAIALLRQRRRLHWHVASVLSPYGRDSALASLRAHLAKGRPLRRVQDARRAAWVLADADRLEEAVALLEDVPLEEVAKRWVLERAYLRNDLCAYRLRLGDREGARAALDAIAPRPRSLRAVLATKDALLAAVGGEPDLALEILAKHPLPARSAHRATADTARAHALAAKGDLDGARALLRSRASADPKWLARAARPEGPATPIAAALAAERGTPYR